MFDFKYCVVYLQEIKTLIMITNNELRIGNHVNFRIDNGENEVFGERGKITGILTGSVYINRIRFLLKDVEPIPSTEEILLKCGFVSDGFQDLIKKLDIHPDIECHLKAFDNDNWNGTEGFSFGLETKDDEDAKHPTETLFHNYAEPWYLHQIQNLYWSLTGQELEVSL